MRRNLFILIITASAIFSATTFAHTYTVKEGWNLLGATDNITNLGSFSQNGSTIWTYADDAWVEVDLSANSTIEKGFGLRLIVIKVLQLLN